MQMQCTLVNQHECGRPVNSLNLVDSVGGIPDGNANTNGRATLRVGTRHQGEFIVRQRVMWVRSAAHWKEHFVVRESVWLMEWPAPPRQVTPHRSPARSHDKKWSCARHPLARSVVKSRSIRHLF